MGFQDLSTATHPVRRRADGAEKLDHRAVIVMTKTMSYDVMIDIDPTSQEEIHRVDFALNETANRYAFHIGSFGYQARMRTNGGRSRCRPTASSRGRRAMGERRRRARRRCRLALRRLPQPGQRG